MRRALIVAALAALTAAGCDLPPLCGQAGYDEPCQELNHDPVADFRVEPADEVFTAPIVGQRIYFVATGYDLDGDRRYYRWDLDGDGEFEREGDRVFRSYATPTTVQVSLHVTDYPQHDGGEGQDTVTKAVRIFTLAEYRANRPPVASFTVSPDQPVVGRPVVLDASGSTDPDGQDLVSYVWEVSDPSDVEWYGGPRPEHTFQTPGEKRIVLWVADPLGRTDATSVRVTVLPAPERRPSPPPGEGGLRPPRASAAAANRALPFSLRLAGGRPDVRLLDLPGRATWPERTLRRFLRAPTRSRFEITEGTPTAPLAARGRVLARARRARACLDLDIRSTPGVLPTGRFTVVGGSGRARRLRAGGTFRFRLDPAGELTALGTVRASRGRPRALPRRCL